MDRIDIHIEVPAMELNPFIGTRLNIGKSPGAIYESEKIEQE